MPMKQRRAAVIESTAEEVSWETDGAIGGRAIVESPGAAGPRGDLAVAPVPEDVDAEQWRKLLAAAPWLMVSDGLLVKMLCHALAEYEQARAQVEAHGVMVMAKSGELVENPWFKLARTGRAEIFKVARELGLTPIVRMRSR